MSCNLVFCVHLYSTNNLFSFQLLCFTFSFWKFCFINFVMLLVFNTQYDTDHTLYKFIQKCHSLLPQTACIFTWFWLTSQMQRANQFFPSTGGRRIWKSLVFEQAVFLTSPQSFLSHKTASYVGYSFLNIFWNFNVNNIFKWLLDKNWYESLIQYRYKNLLKDSNKYRNCRNARTKMF